MSPWHYEVCSTIETLVIFKTSVRLNGQRKDRKSTQGWDIQALWQDGIVDFLLSEDLKKSSPVEVAECASTSKVDKEVVFR